MLKVILLIAGMSIEQTIEFNDMESCLEVRASVIEQDENVDALCIPMGRTDLQFHEFEYFFDKFMEMVERLESRDYYDNLGEYPELEQFE